MKHSKREIIRIDGKTMFPFAGLFARWSDRDATATKIVACRKKTGGEPLAKHTKRAELAADDTSRAMKAGG